jgi:hypothetical protein
MADANTNALLAAIGAGSAILGSLVSSATYYYIEKKKSEDETRRHLRDERKTVYTNLFHELSNFQKRYLQTGFSNFSNPVDVELCEEYGAHLGKASLALRTITDNFATEIELTQNLEIGKLLRETSRFIEDFHIQYQYWRWPDPDAGEVENPIPTQITNSDIEEIEDKLGEIIRLMRAELVPFQEEKKKESQREYWWEMARAKNRWQFWK